MIYFLNFLIHYPWEVGKLSISKENYCLHIQCFNLSLYFIVQIGDPSNETDVIHIKRKITLISFP